MTNRISDRLYNAWKKSIFLLRKYINTKRLIQRFDSCYGKDNYLIIDPPQGIGDILACCCGVEYLPGKDRIIIIIHKKQYLDIQEFFPVENVTLFFTRKILLETSYRNYLPLSIKVYGAQRDFHSMRYNICTAMGISPDVVFHNRYLNDPNRLFPDVKTKQTVFISPSATSCEEELDFDFWNNIASYLYSMGFDVIFNAPSNSPYSKYHKTRFLDLRDTVDLVTQCGFFIGWRSGLCDIVGMYAKATKIIIYPSRPHILISSSLSYSEAYRDCCSLKSLWGTEALEIINNPNLLTQLERIFDNAGQHN